MELDFTVFGYGEHAVKDDEVVVKVHVERRAEAMQEGRAPSGARGVRWACAAVRGA